MEHPLLAELSRRRVFRALIGYGIAAFALLQIIEPVMHGLHWPDAVLSYIVVGLALGFPVVVTLAWIFDVKAGRIERTAAATGRWTGARLAVLLLGIGIGAALPGVLYYFFLRAPARGGTGSSIAASPSIAVIPFLNLSHDQANEYFSDGITEELINALANIDGLRVASRTSAFALKGSKLGARQIGAELNVENLLEGSVQREGNALRVTAQLIKVSDGYHLWAQTYDRELKSIFALEDEIARSIAQALQRKLIRAEGVKPSTTSLEAHDLYLRGRYFWNKRSLEAFRKAEEYFEQAIRKDPGFSLAYAGLGDVIALRLEYDVVRASEVLPKAKEATLKALELDPDLAEAHASLGNILGHDYDWPAALAEFRKAIKLKPGYATARQWHAETLAQLGRLPEAKAEIAAALEADPTSLIINTVSANFLYFDRDYDRALERYRKTLEMDPDFEYARTAMITLHLARAQYVEAAAELHELRSWPALFVLGQRGLIDAMAGRRPEALHSLRELEQRSKSEYIPPSLPGFILLETGDKDRGFAFLLQGCDERDPGLLSVKVDPVLDRHRSDGRFAKLLKCMHID
ncbi:MAG TPA: tetratricopeptide repeat protein [Myxococcales bacterium]|nr:tetratricopeptide repeat protein [Myxococcales bacterium]